MRWQKLALRQLLFLLRVLALALDAAGAHAAATGAAGPALGSGGLGGVGRRVALARRCGGVGRRGVLVLALALALALALVLALALALARRRVVRGRVIAGRGALAGRSGVGLDRSDRVPEAPHSPLAGGRQLRLVPGPLHARVDRALQVVAPRVEDAPPEAHAHIDLMARLPVAVDVLLLAARRDDAGLRVEGLEVLARAHASVLLPCAELLDLLKHQAHLVQHPRAAHAPDVRLVAGGVPGRVMHRLHVEPASGRVAQALRLLRAAAGARRQQEARLVERAARALVDGRGRHV